MTAAHRPSPPPPSSRSLVPSSPEVLHHLAILNEAVGDADRAQKYGALLVSRTPTDSGALNRLGQLFARIAATAASTSGADSAAAVAAAEAQAFHYAAESYRVFPVNLEVISWLGVWYVKSEMYERAVEFFSRASELQPAEVKWKLMVASCHRRMGNTAEAFELYAGIHARHRDNMGERGGRGGITGATRARVRNNLTSPPHTRTHTHCTECLRYLVALSRDLGRRPDVYESKLAKLERSAAAAAAAEQAAADENEADYDQYGDGGGGGGGGAGGGGGYTGGGYEAPAEEQAPSTPVREPQYLRQAAAPSSTGREGRGGAAPERFAAPTGAHHVAPNRGVERGRSGGGKEDDFGDADVGSLLRE